MNTDLDKAKRALRARVRAELAAVDPEQCAEWSAAVCATLRRAFTGQPARCLLAFLPIRGEPEISSFCEEALALGTRLCLPRVDWDRGTMSPRAVTCLSAFEVTRHGIREPLETAPVVRPTDLDCVLVPGLAFDATGRRLGRGSGFYDRFLSGLSVRTVGVAFELQLVPEVPAGPADISVGSIATERRLLRVPRSRPSA